MAERRSPLHGVAGELAAASAQAPEQVRLAETPFLGQITVRLDPSSPAAGAAQEVLGIALPLRPGRSARGDGVDVLWMGPDEWLVLGPDGAAAPRLVAALASALAGHHATVVDVSAQRTGLEVAGSAARDVLARGCSLDLHPRAFAPGDCAQTLLAKAGIVLWQRTDEPAYLLLVRASFAEYLAAWLLDASVEEREGGLDAAAPPRVTVGARSA
jgi:sarcosine oxidase subunit gamma